MLLDFIKNYKEQRNGEMLNMKKTVTFLTSLLLMFVLAACGSRGRENSSESSVSAGESHALESTEESSMQQNDMTT